METCIDRIKYLKSKKKITNERLSEMTGIPLGTLSKLVAGISDSPKLDNVIAIAEALGTSVDYIATGKPENTNNATLNNEEISVIEEYRKLDYWGKSAVGAVLREESNRVANTASADTAQQSIFSQDKILRSKSGKNNRQNKRSILLYDLPVSAGTGEYLDSDNAEHISVSWNEKTAVADYALRVSGNSMEPNYHDQDILLIQGVNEVGVGELGIFVLDGAGYFKVFGGDCLISLNPAYQPIMLCDYSEIKCLGRVLGRLRRKVPAEIN